MVVLGISGGFRAGYQDVSACLVIDGRVVAAIEEERLSRIKFSPGRLPYLSIIEVLKIANIKIQDVDILAFHGLTWGDEIDQKIRDYFKYHFGYSPPIKRFHHHDCHAASAYYASGFNDALIISLDNSGDGISTQICLGKKDTLQLIDRFERPNSIGLFFQTITQFCGFIKDSDEYKLMGLAAFGDRNKFDFSWLIDFVNGELKLNTKYINTVPFKSSSLHRDEMNFNENFLKKVTGNRRIPGSDFTSFYKDVAASAQNHLEKTVIKMLSHYYKKTGKRNICLAGGVALNCVVNQHIMNLPWCDNLFIQPASNDAGIALGAAWLASEENGIHPIKPENIFLGNSYSNDEIRETIKGYNLKYEEIDDFAETASEMIIQDKVIGWFQGRMEFGPRALGSRSILANATNDQMKDLVNRKIKFRESFRPFGPTVLEEDFDKYFSGKQHISPYMTITYDVKKEMQNKIASVSHIDNTARIQTVNKKQNDSYYFLLQKIKQKTGHGIILNTSFNLANEPIVCLPQNAIASFFASGLDALIIGDFLLRK